MSKVRFGNLDGVHRVKKNSMLESMGISVVIFTVAMFLFLYAISFTSQSTTAEQKENLSNAIERTMMQCYVTEGRYPSSVEYMVDNYGLYYDHTRYRVDYVVFGSNMRPDVTIVELEEEY